MQVVFSSAVGRAQTCIANEYLAVALLLEFTEFFAE